MVFGGNPEEIRTWKNDISYRQIMDECKRMPPGELWTDKAFPADDDRSIYVNGRTTASGKPYANGNIRWLRPHEVKGADINQLALIKDGADAGDVIQGELGDCYLLGAMSSIAAKDLLHPIIVDENDGCYPAIECIKEGFICFRLYKFGEWQEVNVDTLLPCNENNECIFAHGNDPNELWVPLLEKAYAKLHGSYEALDGGSVVAALVDLTGGVGESIDMTEDDTVYEIADGSFWKRARLHASLAHPSPLSLSTSLTIPPSPFHVSHDTTTLARRPQAVRDQGRQEAKGCRRSRHQRPVPPRRRALSIVRP